MFPQVLVQPAAYGLPAVAMENLHPDSVVNAEAGYLVKSEANLLVSLDCCRLTTVCVKKCRPHLRGAPRRLTGTLFIGLGEGIYGGNCQPS